MHPPPPLAQVAAGLQCSGKSRDQAERGIGSGLDVSEHFADVGRVFRGHNRPAPTVVIMTTVARNRTDQSYQLPSKRRW